MSKYLTDKKWIIIIAIICSVLWGSAFPVVKISYDEMSIGANIYGKILLAGMRFFLASIFIFVMLKIFMKEPLKVSKGELKRISILGLFQTLILNIFFYIGMSNTSGMKGAILSSTENFFVVILAHFVYQNDKINNRKVIGLLLGFLGIVFANWGKNFGFDFSITGEGFMIMFTMSGAISTILSKKLCKSIHPFVVNAYQMLIGSSVLLILGVVLKGYEGIVFTPKSIVLLIYLAFVSAIAFSLWYSLLKYNKAGEVTIYRFMIPVAGVLLSLILIKDEVFSIFTIISLICVAIGISIVNKSKN